jgi:hypothetical protein
MHLIFCFEGKHGCHQNHATDLEVPVAKGLCDYLFEAENKLHGGFNPTYCSLILWIV